MTNIDRALLSPEQKSRLDEADRRHGFCGKCGRLMREELGGNGDLIVRECPVYGSMFRDQAGHDMATYGRIAKGLLKTNYNRETGERNA